MPQLTVAVGPECAGCRWLQGSQRCVLPAELDALERLPCRAFVHCARRGLMLWSNHPNRGVDGGYARPRPAVLTADAEARVDAAWRLVLAGGEGGPPVRGLGRTDGGATEVEVQFRSWDPSEPQPSLVLELHHERPVTDRSPIGVYEIAQRVVQALGYSAAITNLDLVVVWHAAGNGPNGGPPAEPGTTLDQLVGPDDITGAHNPFAAVVNQPKPATVHGRSGTVYHALDLGGDGGPRWLLWYWRSSPTVSSAPVTAERLQLLEATVTQFVSRLQRLGLVEESRVPTSIDLRSLSEREREIVEHLIGGMRVSAIARTLYISESTVRTHLSAAFRKLGVASQSELMDQVMSTPVDKS